MPYSKAMEKLKVLKTKTLDLFGSEWKIEWIDGIIREGGDCYWGMSYHSSNTIRVSTCNSEGKKLSKEQLQIILLHELTHAILGEGAYHDECDNEPMVEWMAKCWNKVLKSSIL